MKRKHKHFLTKLETVGNTHKDSLLTPTSMSLRRNQPAPLSSSNVVRNPATPIPKSDNSILLSLFPWEFRKVCFNFTMVIMQYFMCNYWHNLYWKEVL